MEYYCHDSVHVYVFNVKMMKLPVFKEYKRGRRIFLAGVGPSEKVSFMDVGFFL
jgi:hypothetical protein